MRYYIIVGEASGDLHASNLMKELKKEDSEASFRGFGGDRMQQQGLELVKHYRELDFMGFVKVALNLRTVLKNIEICKKDILAFKPDVVILVDYPGFNLRIAKFLKKVGIKNFYYISPQVWAWKQSRVKQIRKNIDRMYVILPFEKDFYKRFHYEVDFVGHPLLDSLQTEATSFDKEQFLQEHHLPLDKKLIALLPGSRPQEIKTMLPIMSSLKEDFPDYQFVIAGVKTASETLYTPFLRDNVTIVYNATHDLVRAANAALVTSGTASLETALLKTPEVICYKGDYLSYLIARRLIKVKYIGLPNLIMDKPIVKELIQGDFNRSNIREELNNLLQNSEKQEQLHADYHALIQKLGGQGASARAAKMMYERVRN